MVDLAQIEARMLAWLAKDEQLLANFRNNIDNYKIMAAEIFEKLVAHPAKYTFVRPLGDI